MNDKGLLTNSELKKWMQDHNPIWTCVGVARLAEDEMKVEIEVVAHDPK
jgi:enamine deaminase RidA (YjgF/YER057c/UK114 family)